MNKGCFPACLLALGLFGCDSSESTANSTEQIDTDTYHEKTFSWENPENNPQAFAARPAGSKVTMMTRAQADSVARELEKKLASRSYSEGLWKPIDYACDELLLAFWNEYGETVVDGQTVLDEEILKRSCNKISEASSNAGVVAARTAAGSNPPSEAIDRKYPYKMIGNSWKDFNIGVYKSTGGETQFKKERTRYWVKGWYDTDASRIGVRIYLFDCTDGGGGRACVLNRSTSDWYANDDYVSKRDFAVGASVSGTLSGMYPQISWTTVGNYLNRAAPFIVDPSWVQNKINTANSTANTIDGRGGLLGEWTVDLLYNVSSFFDGLNGYYSAFYTTMGLDTQVPNIGTVSLRTADGVISLHSVDHAGMKFRAISSAGMGNWNSFNQYKKLDYVTW